MADEGAVIRIGSAAAAAVLRVVGMLELGEGLAGVLDPEVGDSRATAQLAVAPEVGNERIVGAEREFTAADQRIDQNRPLVGEALQLAVTVELVAKEVGEHEQPGAKLGSDPGEPGLVQLEEALAAALLEQRRGDAPVHVRA